MYDLFDISSGNLIESFMSEETAWATVAEILSREPDSADEMVLFSFCDETGMLTGPALTGDDLRRH